LVLDLQVLEEIEQALGPERMELVYFLVLMSLGLVMQLLELVK
jgi:hypothetical protein